MANAAPLVVVLAGPNGAGKTTAARTVLADTLRLLNFVNADTIAQGLSGFNPASTAVEAGRIMLQRLRVLAAQRASFAFETTLAGRSYARWLRSLRRTGYNVHLIYLWLASADLAVQRVAERVRMGGHDIPEGTLRQRYERSPVNFFRLYRPIATTWAVYDNSQPSAPQPVAHGDETGREAVLNETVWNEIRKGAIDE